MMKAKIKKHKFHIKYNTIWKNDLISQLEGFIPYVKIIKVIIKFFFTSTNKYLFCAWYFIFFYSLFSLIICAIYLLWKQKKIYLIKFLSWVLKNKKCSHIYIVLQKK